MTRFQTIFQLSRGLLVAAFVLLVTVQGTWRPSTLAAAIDVFSAGSDAQLSGRAESQPGVRCGKENPDAVLVGPTVSISPRGGPSYDPATALDPESPDFEDDESQHGSYAVARITLDPFPPVRAAEHGVAPVVPWIAPHVACGHPRGPPARIL